MPSAVRESDRAEGLLSLAKMPRLVELSHPVCGTGQGACFDPITANGRV